MPDDEKTDEKAFNETLKRMLKTPPKPHEKAEKRKGDDRSRRLPVSDEDKED